MNVSQNIEKKSKKVAEDLSEAKLIREEVKTRELKLNDRENKYREDIKAEMMNRFLGVK